MIKRIFSTLTLWTLLLFTIYFFNAAGFAALLLVLALASGYEACKLLERCDAKPSFKIFAALTVLFFIPTLHPALFITYFFVICVFLFFLIPVFFAIWLLRDPYGDLLKKTILPTFFTFLFISFMLLVYAVFAWAYNADHCYGCTGKEQSYSGVILAIMIIAAAKFTDVGGYLFGMFFGRHKLAPTMSPKKTWEGAVGGVLVSMLVTVGMALGLADMISINLPPWKAAVIALPISIVSIISDLLESVLKRRADIKDSGNTIPGIGGALDLADSMLLAGPVGVVAFLMFEIF